MAERNKKLKVLGIIVLIAVGIALVTFAIRSNNVLLLKSQGLIADKQRSLILTSLGIMLLIVIPLFSYAAYVGFKFRASKNQTALETKANPKLQAAWWAFPSIIVAILSVFVWKNAHALDPFQPIASDKQPITIQVVALQWKWLFIYPAQNIATVNYVEFPKQTPVDFELTSDPLMNSFWIPQLGGQMYAMAGMTTHLHLLADATGTFDGSAAEINGQGFAGMRFKAHAVSDSDFDAWVNSVKSDPKTLSLAAYNQLTKDSQNNPAGQYSSVEKNLYDQIVFKYMNH